jgi:hypothetical protein
MTCVRAPVRGLPAPIAPDRDFALHEGVVPHGRWDCSVPAGIGVAREWRWARPGRPLPLPAYVVGRRPSFAGRRGDIKRACLGKQPWRSEFPRSSRFADTLLRTYRNNLRLAARNDRLARLNRQLQELYGPLLALVHAGNRSWDVFRSQYRPGGSYWGRPPAPSEQEAHAWRLWVSTVFMPLNRQMRDAVVTHADLLVEDDVKSCLLDLCAHVAAYEAILKRWEEGGYAEHAPPLPFPREDLSASLSALLDRHFSPHPSAV